ncbi:maleylacetoacetate isomerase [Neptuniibacter halophilus]|uniref:maleylacetoacetate isomerase n=1 Tax=Neptuniibacter halophilus TaxID=651666 RepID=UPI0025726C29|nr:maleylacetoacetate isomerase [Neptuniibacter halophilus]
MILYDYYRSSAAYRVRIALNLKGLSYTRVAVDLLSGEQRSDAYLRQNPQGLVPALEDEGRVYLQSLAICEYLEDKFSQPALLPKDIHSRACVRSLAHLIACDTHPLNNLRVLNYLRDELHVDDQQRQLWYQHWLQPALEAFETRLHRSGQSGLCCYGDNPTLADICLLPQLYNARRFAVDFSQLPLICRIEQHCLSLPAFQQAHPDHPG